MGRAKFEDILAESLAAVLEGRRSVEECLSLYPAWRDRLEPLLRTALELASSFQDQPPAQTQERHLERFLEAARVRRRARLILGPAEQAVPLWRFALGGVTAAFVAGALAFVSATLMSDEQRPASPAVSIGPFAPAPVERPAPEDTTTPLERAREQVAELEESVREDEAVDVHLVGEVTAATQQLAASLEEPENLVLLDRVAAVSVASAGYDLLQTLDERASGFEAHVVESGLEVTEDVLQKLGATPEPAPSANASPQPTPVQTATATPSTTATPIAPPPP